MTVAKLAFAPLLVVAAGFFGPAIVAVAEAVVGALNLPVAVAEVAGEAAAESEVVNVVAGRPQPAAVAEAEPVAAVEAVAAAVALASLGAAAEAVVGAVVEAVDMSVAVAVVEAGEVVAVDPPVAVTVVEVAVAGGPEPAAVAVPMAGTAGGASGRILDDLPEGDRHPARAGPPLAPHARFTGFWGLGTWRNELRAPACVV